jgi:hypothetical protein
MSFGVLRYRGTISERMCSYRWHQPWEHRGSCDDGASNRDNLYLLLTMFD